MSPVITGVCARMAGKGDQRGSFRLWEDDVNVLLEDVIGVRRGRGARFLGLEAIRLSGGETGITDGDRERNEVWIGGTEVGGACERGKTHGRRRRRAGWGAGDAMVTVAANQGLVNDVFRLV